MSKRENLSAQELGSLTLIFLKLEKESAIPDGHSNDEIHRSVQENLKHLEDG
jgi:hypothetical protein